MDAPLKGIRIIDWTIWQQGPVATTMLADMGAEVIKIEERDKGDPGRDIFAIGGASAQRERRTTIISRQTIDTSRASRSISASRSAREIVYKLAEKSDVFVQNFRKGVAERLGLGYEDLRARNPKIIYANSTGYGPNGPDSGEPSFDYMAQARSGMMNIASVKTGRADLPERRRRRSDGRDHARLRRHDRAGRARALWNRPGGQCFASRLDDRAARTQRFDATMMGKEFPRNTRDDAFNPLWNHYKCADGKWLCLGMLQTDRYWKDFCVALGIPELVERFALRRYEVARQKPSRAGCYSRSSVRDKAARRMDAKS